MIKTKTIATVGPASAEESVLGRMLEAGVDVVRLNFAHGTLEEHGRVLELARRLAGERDTALAVLGDLGGPKIRLGKIDPQDCHLCAGDDLVIEREEVLGNRRRVSTTYPQIVNEVRPGDRVLIDDGRILLRVETTAGDHVVCRCLSGGDLADHKGINLPDTRLETPSLTEKDLDDLRWAARHEVDYVALSFVRHADDIRDLARRMAEAGCDARTVAKIEKPQAIEHIDAIIDEADVILVARGDLAVEMEHARVPPIQKDITRRCRRAGKAVIIATQMLQSMVEDPSPTRAEVSDVANAILDNADAVMLSSETSVGRYPVEAVACLQRIAAEAEAYQLQQEDVVAPRIVHRALAVTSSLAHSARQLAERLKPPLIAVWTQSGNSARLLSKNRFQQPILALTENGRTLNKLALDYGVIPMKSACPQDTVEMLRCLDRIILQEGWASKGDRIIVVAGTHFKRTGGNNALLIHQVGEV